MEPTYIVGLVTAPLKEVGQKIARSLVESQLAACVNIIAPVISVYSWQGEIQQDEEVLLIIKTRYELFESQVMPAVRAAHPYDVPEIIALPIQAGSRDYLDWIQDVTPSNPSETK